MSNEPKTIQVSAAQMHWAKPLERNLAEIEKYIRLAATEGSRVLLLPESSITGYYFPHAVTLSRQTVLDALDTVCRMAADAGIWVIAGSIRKWKDTHLNLAHVIDPAGSVTYEYAKAQMAGEDEQKYCTPGNKVAFFQIDGIDCTMSICRDGRHPELFRIPAMMGARIFFQPSCSSEHIEAVVWKRISGRAQQAAGPKSYIHHVVANTVGQSPDGKQSSSGQSFIRDCTGLPLAEAGYYEEGMITGVLDLEKSTGFYAKQSAENPKFLREHWRAMMDAVRAQKDRNPEDE